MWVREVVFVCFERKYREVGGVLQGCDVVYCYRYVMYARVERIYLVYKLAVWH